MRSTQQQAALAPSPFRINPRISSVQNRKRKGSSPNRGFQPGTNAAEGNDTDSDAFQEGGSTSAATRKRKRTSSVASFKAGAATSAKKKRCLTSASTSATVDMMPLNALPSQFSRLYSLFGRLNTVHSFLAAQREVVCTFERLSIGINTSSAAEVLTLNDLARMKVLFPTMRLLWAPRSSLEDASLAELKAATGVHESLNKRGSPTLENIREQKDGYTLVVEFTDVKDMGVARIPVGVDEKGRKFGNNSVSLIKQVKYPASNVAALPKLIRARNEKFRASIDAFCKMGSIADAWDRLVELAIDVMPPDPGWTNDKHGVGPMNSRLQKDGGLMGFLDHIKEPKNGYESRVPKEGWKTYDTRPASYGNLDHVLPLEVSAALSDSLGITNLYSHQAQAIKAIDRGENVVVATSTSSGKTLIYQLPFLSSVTQDHDARALFIFPTKALAQDQKRSLMDLLSHCPSLADTVTVDTYDGDTPLEGDVRRKIRDTASCVFSNMDMLHVSILPGHRGWKFFLQNLKFIIVDELHYYTGRFGAHSAYVMRRLRRICEYYGNESVRFISCSATIANPVEHMRAFFGIEQATLIDVDGSPHGRKHHLLWTPEFRNEDDKKQGRGSLLDETVQLCRMLLDWRVKFICFARTRRMTELILRELREDAGDLVLGYRGGYGRHERREIEGKMFGGQLYGIVATNALELGVDIGSIDAVLHCGFPFSFASYRQQSGRAGRREQDSVSVLIADHENPLDRTLIENPASLYTSPLETVKLDLDNPLTQEPHLHCTASEQALSRRDIPMYFPASAIESADRFLSWDERHSVFHADRRYNGRPANHFPVRCTDSEEGVRVVEVSSGLELEEVEAERVPFTLFEGAIFLHQGLSYHVCDVNMDRRYAKVRLTNVDYTTAVRDFTDVDPIKTLESVRIRKAPPTAIGDLEGDGYAHFGEIQISTSIFGFFKLNPKTMKVLEAVNGIESEPILREAMGIWMDVPQSTVDLLEALDINIDFAVHAASHALLELLPTCIVIPTTNGRDVRTDCRSQKARRWRPPRLVLYEHQRLGLLEKSLSHMRDLVSRALNRVASCPCESGCAHCVARSGCKEANEALDKEGAIRVLEGVLGWGFGDDEDVKIVGVN